MPKEHHRGMHEHHPLSGRQPRPVLARGAATSSPFIGIHSPQEDLGQNVRLPDRLGRGRRGTTRPLFSTYARSTMSSTPLMLCSTTRMDVCSLWLISETFSNTSRTMRGARPQGGLVQEQHLGSRHEAAAQRQHLLLASRHLAGQVATLLVQHGKQLHCGVQPALFFQPGRSSKGSPSPGFPRWSGG